MLPVDVVESCIKVHRCSECNIQHICTKFIHRYDNPPTEFVQYLQMKGVRVLLSKEEL